MWSPPVSYTNSSGGTSPSSPPPPPTGVYASDCIDGLVYLMVRMLMILSFMANLDHVTRVIVQSEIFIVYNWSGTMDMHLSIEKSLVIHFGTNNPCYQYYCIKRELPSSVNFVDLGVVQCFNATYIEQVTTVAQKGRRLARLCSRLLSCRNADFMLRVYKKLYMSCCTPLWSGLPIYVVRSRTKK